MREINKVIIHCSDTPPSMDIGAAEIDQWHKSKGWDGIGYHFVIRRDGAVESGRPVNRVGAHTKGENHDSIGICLIGGGGGMFDYTVAQFESLRLLVNSCRTIFGCEIKGHKDYSAKYCPNFDVVEWFG